MTRTMTYEDAVTYLRSFTDYERKMTEVYAPEKMDPVRPARLLCHLGDPHLRFPSVHVAGTKGKGSVAAMCATCLQAAGLRVGLYTSPHLVELRERIRVLTPADADGRIKQARFASLVERLRAVVPRIPGLTWFELITAVAFMHFAQQQVDVAVVEVGLGGRLDATNVITPLVSTITRLSLDHTGLLGNTVAEIAVEKAGIIKSGVPVVSAPQAPEALAQLQRIAQARQAPLTVVGREWQYEGSRPHEVNRLTIARTCDPAFVPVGTSFTLGLRGAHQQENAAVTLASLQQIHARFPSLTIAALQEGLAAVQWPGRLHILYQGAATPTILADGAHNGDSARRLADFLVEACTHERLWLVFGATADKNVAAILQPLLPLAEGVIVTQAAHPRAAAPAVLQQEVAALGYEAIGALNVCAAVRAAWERAAPGDLICVTGSLFVVGDLLNCWESLQSHLLGHEVT